MSRNCTNTSSVLRPFKFTSFRKVTLAKTLAARALGFFLGATWKLQNSFLASLAQAKTQCVFRWRGNWNRCGFCTHTSEPSEPPSEAAPRGLCSPLRRGERPNRAQRSQRSFASCWCAIPFLHPKTIFHPLAKQDLIHPTQCINGSDYGESLRGVESVDFNESHHDRTRFPLSAQARRCRDRRPASPHSCTRRRLPPRPADRGIQDNVNSYNIGDTNDNIDRSP